MNKINLMMGLCFASLSLVACQSNQPRTMWAPEVDTSLNVPPVNTGGTSKTAPYEHCNYGEDCDMETSKVTVDRYETPNGGYGKTVTKSKTKTQSDNSKAKKTTISFEPDEMGGGVMTVTEED